jgi:C1A family cysteine protease
MSLINATVTADSLDWSTKGAVTPVKNQAQCGSCWAFSTTGSLEGAFQIAGNPLTSLSEQDLVSCDNSAHGGTDQGCNGGLMDNAFKWIEKNGICTEAAYPYTSGGGSSGTCKTSCAKAVTLTGFTDVPNEGAMLAALAKGPVSVAIEADKSAFQLYKGGVLDNAKCGKKLDHGVLAIGYGTDSGKGYYKVKNSWGASWGESGYIRMVQGKDQCGIADSASYPTGAKAMGPGPGPASGPAPGPSPHRGAVWNFSPDGPARAHARSVAMPRSTPGKPVGSVGPFPFPISST